MTSAGIARYQSAPCPVPNYPGVPEADLGPNYSCGYLTVRENRSVPDGRTIRILVARVKAAAATPRPDPIVFLAGGPGGAGTLSAPGVVAGGMNADRDVIFVNQRGTMHSEPHLSCPEMDEFAARSIGLVYASASTAALDAAAIAACRERLARAGADLAAYNTRENAADIAELRVALGIAEWNVYGVSYGTDLALQLLRDHPEGIRSVVLDSVVPPNRNIIDQWWEAPASGLAAIAAACAAQSACAAAYPDLAAIYTATVNRLHATPAEIDVRNAAGATVRVTIDGFKLIPLLLEWSASPTLVVDFPRMIDNLANGDGTLAAAAIAASDVPAVQRGLLGAGLALTTYCEEMANWTTPERALAQARTLDAGAPRRSAADRADRQLLLRRMPRMGPRPVRSRIARTCDQCRADADPRGHVRRQHGAGVGGAGDAGAFQRRGAALPRCGPRRAAHVRLRAVDHDGLPRPSGRLRRSRVHRADDASGVPDPVGQGAVPSARRLAVSSGSAVAPAVRSHDVRTRLQTEACGCRRPWW